MNNSNTLRLQKKLFTLSLLLTISSLYVFSQETTEKHAILTDKFELALGVFYPSKRIHAGVDGSATDSDIKFDQRFGFEDSQTTLFFSTNWRFAKKWKLSLDYFSLKYSGSKVLEEDIYWDDLTFIAGVNVDASTGFNLYRIYFGRLFTTGAKHEFGGGLGVHAVNFRTTLEGNAQIDETEHSYEKSRKSVTLPLPNFGLWYFWTPNKKWAFLSKFDVFYLAIGDFSGSLINISSGVNYQFLNNFGASFHYRIIDIGAQFNTSDWKGDFNVAFYGPSLTITANF